MNIKLLDIRNKEIAENVVALQRASYKVEAELIGSHEIPPLHETVEELCESEETFCGAFIEEELVGMVSYIVDGGIFDIYRMAVSPKHFRKGIGNMLLEYVLNLGKDEFVEKFVVSTGMKNEPAKHLYLKNGFVQLGDKSVPGGLMITSFEKKVKR